MGASDRDYMRADPRRGSGWRPGRITWWIIGINAVLWLVFSSSANRGGSGLARFFYEHLMLHPDEVFGRGKIWQLFTSFWLHDWNSASHVFFNMLALFFFGRTAESQLGPRGYLKLYLLGGLVASVIYTLWALIGGTPNPALGASGAVFAVLVWVACMHPRRTVYMMMILPMPMWLAVGVFIIGLEFYRLAEGVHEGAAVAHLAGAAWGYVFFRFFRRWSSERGPGGWLVKLRRKRDAQTTARHQQNEAAVRARVDALLAKISSDGIGALSEDEKSFLQDASKRFQ